MNESYQHLSNTVVHLHHFDPPPAPLANVDVTFKISNFYDFSLERLIQYETVLQDLHTPSTTTTTTNTTPVSATPPLRLLSDVRSSSSSAATLAVAVAVVVDASSIPTRLSSLLQQERERELELNTAPSIPSIPSIQTTTLSALPQQELTVKDLPSPSDALKFLRRNKSPRKVVLRSSRKRARQNTTGTVPPTQATNTEHTPHQLDPINLHEQEDVKRARTYTLPVLAVSDLYTPTPTPSSVSSPSSSHSHSTAVLHTVRSPIGNKENVAMQIDKAQEQVVVVVQSTAGAPAHTTPQKMALVKVKAAPACRTPKELEDELDDCKRQLLELKKVVSLLSSNTTTSAITT
jgi:hypothetical protein